jgi:hypothetical protein
MVEVAEMLLESQRIREQLRKDGWERVVSPPLVNNEWVWKHPAWGFKTQTEAVKCIIPE